MPTELLDFFEPNRKRIDAVPSVFRGHSLACENVSKVSTAVFASDFDSPHPVRNVNVPLDRTLDFVIERGPAAVAVKFVARTIEWGVATAADERALLFVVQIFARPRPLRAFLGDDVFFLLCELIPIFHFQKF